MKENLKAFLSDIKMEKKFPQGCRTPEFIKENVDHTELDNIRKITITTTKRNFLCVQDTIDNVTMQMTNQGEEIGSMVSQKAVLLTFQEFQGMIRKTNVPKENQAKGILRKVHKEGNIHDI